MKNKKNIIFLLLILLLMVSCNQKENVEIDKNYPVKIIDATKNEITIKDKPKKIISLSPNNTEILFALGLDEEIVGVTSLCNYPEEAKMKEKISYIDDIDFEKIKELEPDIIIEQGNGKSDNRKKLEEEGFTVISLNPYNIDGISKSILTIGEVVGKVEESKEISKDILDRRDKIVKLAEKQEEKKVFYQYWDSPLITVGENTIVDQLINLSGGINIGRNYGKDYPDIKAEEVVKENPDIYIIRKNENTKLDEIKNKEEYKELKFVKNNNIYTIEEDIVSILGPRIIDGLEFFFESIHQQKIENK